MSLESIIQQQNETIARLTNTLTQLLSSSSSPPDTYNNGGDELPKKLTYGQGSIRKQERKNKNGTIYKWYQIRWYDEYGKRQQKSATTLKKCYAILSQNNKRSIKNTRNYAKTFGEYMSEWYSTYRANECGVARNNTCLLQISRIPKEIMNKPLPAVTAIELQQYINSMEHANPRADTQQLLTACLKYAFNSGHIKANIGMLLKVELPENKPKQILPRNLEEKFVNSFPEEYQGYVIGLIYTGARLGEFMSLNENWQTDIDYVNKKVKIRETKSLRQKDIRAGRTFMFREIPLLPEVAKINFPLKTIKQKTLNKNFNKVLTKLNEEDKDLKLKVTPHCMRHTFVSRCNEIGITKSVIKEIVGHKTDKMNAHYTHNTSELLDKEFAKLSISSPISIPIRFPDGKNDTEKVDNAANCHPKMIDFAS